MPQSMLHSIECERENSKLYKLIGDITKICAYCGFRNLELLRPCFDFLGAIMSSADTIRTAVGIVGNVISLVLFLSPSPTFYRIWKKGTVEQFSAVPYLATLLNCMLWVIYGLPVVQPNSLLVLTINAAGVAIELAYVSLFLVYSTGGRRHRVLLALLAEVAFVGAVALLVLMLAHSRERRSVVVGVLCVFFAVLMYAAPLSVMKLVIQTKSVEYMPLFLSLAYFLNGLCWTTYSLFRFDLFILVPNALGLLLTSGQLALHVIYYKSTRRQMAARKMELVEVTAVGEGSKTSNVQQNGNHR